MIPRSTNQYKHVRQPVYILSFNVIEIISKVIRIEGAEGFSLARVTYWSGSYQIWQVLPTPSSDYSGTSI